MKVYYVVTYENKKGIMQNAYFARRDHAMRCAMNRLRYGTYPAVTVSTCACDDKRQICTKTYFK